MSAITLTFGDCAENHVGMQQIGTIADEGIHVAHLEGLRDRFGGELIDLGEALPAETANFGTPEEASVYILRGGVALMGVSPDELMEEQMALEWDKKYFDRRRGRVLNKNARHNLCYSQEGQEPDYEAGRGRIVPFESVPLLWALKGALEENFGLPALQVEGNLYYDTRKTGIGFHGDTERRIVVGVRLGESIPLHYQWYYRGERIGDRVALELNHGDVYVMSEKATGHDWKKRNKPTLRHAAGCAKYLK